MGILKSLIGKTSKRKKLKNQEIILKVEFEDKSKHYDSDAAHFSVKAESFPGMEGIVPYEKRIKTSSKTKEGLYPPEIVMLYFCNKGNRYSAKNKDCPAYWQTEYGISDIDKFLSGIEKKGFLELKNGYYKTTAKGEEAVKITKRLFGHIEQRILAGHGKYWTC